MTQKRALMRCRPPNPSRQGSLNIPPCIREVGPMPKAAASLICWLLLVGNMFGADEIDYLKDIKPLLSRRCSACHGALKQESKLRLDTAAAIRQGGEQGAAIVPGQSKESLLIKAVAGADGW